MNKQVQQSGFDIAECLYGNSPGIFQVRNLHGSKIAEYTTKAETKNFLRKRDHDKYEIWHLESKPGQLIGNYPGRQFINNNKKRKTNDNTT